MAHGNDMRLAYVPDSTSQISECIRMLRLTKVRSYAVLYTSSLFATTALLLWAFKITEDPSSPIDTLGFSDTANVRPFPFKANFELRVKNLKEIVEANLASLT